MKLRNKAKIIKISTSAGWGGSLDRVPACEPKGHQFDSQARTYAWVAGQVPSRGRTRDNHTLMFLSLSPSLPLSLKINKLKKENAQNQKVKDEWITDLSVKTQNYKIPENNTRENLGDL